MTTLSFQKVIWKPSELTVNPNNYLIRSFMTVVCSDDLNDSFKVHHRPLLKSTTPSTYNFQDQTDLKEKLNKKVCAQIEASFDYNEYFDEIVCFCTVKFFRILFYLNFSVDETLCFRATQIKNYKNNKFYEISLTFFIYFNLHISKNYIYMYK